jgi:hypothetical protein
LSMVAGVLLVVFTCALIVKLPGMISSQDRPISAAWLLWLLASLVLLINAAYRDGTVQQPYPRLVGLALRCAIPLTVVIALTAFYAISIRIHRYGFTVERVWACVVALAGLAYALGYSMAVRAKDVWMRGIASVNVYVALSLIALLMLTLTPMVSPYRIAANSQFRHATSSAAMPAQSGENDALRYLRFDAGRYGLERLRELSRLKEGAAAAALAQAAQRFLATQNRYENYARSADDVLDKLAVYPTGASLEAALLTKLHEDVAGPKAQRSYLLGGSEHPVGLFVDMNGDGVQEFVLIGCNQSALYHRQGQSWQYGGMLLATNNSATYDLAEQLRSGDFSVDLPRWRELRIGERHFRLQGEP